MEFIADLHIHSHYSRATSKECSPENLDLWAQRKGIDLLGTGDFTHRAWRTEIAEKCIPTGNGLYRLKTDWRKADHHTTMPVHFVVTGEISSIYKKNGRTRKVHNLIILPSLEAAEKLSLQLEAIGNLHSDGRPILGLDSKALLDMTLNVCPEALFIPAHIWTPHFSVLGANSGFDSIDECYEDLSKYIYAVETGLSSDPPMNWRLSDLDRFTLISNSDAHSPANLAREANIFSTDLTYEAFHLALKNNNRSAFKGTIEFFPEEGKYHLDGHRACRIQWEPSATIAANGICPVCNRKLTVGVLHRTEVLADRPEGFKPETACNFIRLTSLPTIISASLGCGPGSIRATSCYEKMLDSLGSELTILRTVPIDDIKAAAGSLVAEGVRRVRNGQLRLSAGYDGEYGVIEIFSEAERREFTGQTVLFVDLITAPSPERKKQPVPGSIKPDKQPAHSTESDTGSERLDPHQQEAVTAGIGAQMVIAGPGTGKTRTLVSRIGYLLNDLHVPPSAITAVTFTNKAAGEMRKRCSSFLDRRKLRSLTIGTFHGICLQLLREHSPEQPPTIIDESTALVMIRELIEEYQVPQKPSELLRQFSLAKTSGTPVEEALNTDINKMYTIYQKKLVSFGAVDFDDLLLNTLHILSANSMNPSSTKRFGYLLVDEFQDINAIQYELVKAWGGRTGNIFVIGDPHQSIYGFRGASPQFFATFKNDFPQAVTITLSRNYRSPEAIVESAKSIISKSTAPLIHPTSFTSVNNDPSFIRLVITRNEHAEARYIAESINRLVGGVDMLDAHRFTSLNDDSHSSYGFFDIAVLFRTHRQAAAIERNFVQEGIPYRVAGRDTSLNSPEVAGVCSLLKFLLNPNDIFSLMVTLRHFDIPTTFVSEYAAGSKTLDHIATFLDSHLYNDTLPITALYEEMKSSKHPYDIISRFSTFMGYNNATSIKHLLHIAESYDNTPSLIQSLTLGTDADILRNGFGRSQGDTVLLSTLHAAKGLEFPITFICGVNEGTLPLLNSQGECADIDEERRLFYVGITRARRQLICTTAKQRTMYGETADCPASRFLEDIDSEYVQREEYRPEPVVTQMRLL